MEKQKQGTNDRETASMSNTIPARWLEVFV
jgi:hypothetical protein